LRPFTRYTLFRFRSFIQITCSFYERCFLVILYSLDGFTLFLGSATPFFPPIQSTPNIEMSRSFLLSAALLAVRVSAQGSGQFTDEKTGITFQGYHHSSGYKLGYALPEKPTTDVIIQLQAPITNDGGWAGLSLVC
jgi:hypothetical protein